MKHDNLAMSAFPAGVDFHAVGKGCYRDTDRYIHLDLSKKRTESIKAPLSRLPAMDAGHVQILVRRANGTVLFLDHAATDSRNTSR